MAATDLYNPALLDHVQHPDHNEAVAGATHVHEGINPSCGDDLTLHVRVGADGTIEDAGWTGTGCAVSKASADMMSDLILGETPERARELCALFAQMIRGEQTDATLLEDELDEAACLQTVSKMPARVKCAELAWRTLDEMLSGKVASATTTESGD
jgi:nitrogen fixation NifU-like protein